jgi:hypothetical protein
MTKIVFAEGCFDDFEGTPEELAELISQIELAAETGQLFEDAEPVSDEEIEMLEKILEGRQRRQ